MGHGSNVRGIETTATYDHDKAQFVLHSPTQTSIKFWIGGLAKVATHTTVFANLIVDGKNQGVHAFVCRIRDPETHMPLSGIIIGDCGEKFGLPGMDNGWCQFNHFRIPKDALLDKLSRVDEEGKF